MPPTVPGVPASSVTATVTGAPLVTSEPPPLGLARYEIGPEIARGGMGRVVEATDTLLGRTVAIKQVLGADPDTLRRFARETRITARLEHPAIVPVHDAGGLDDSGTPYYVMRKISGRPLERLVASADELTQRLVLVPHIVAAAQAIAHAHARGVVHRDIKPSNILVGELGETIVIDWGLAKATAEPDDPLDPAALARALPAVVDGDDGIHTRTGIVYGTPGFMSPEQLRGKPVDERGDVYALGATLYHLLLRKPPHWATDPGTMMQAAAHAPATPIADVVPGVPRELATIVDTALAFDPGQRYPDARALADELQRFLDGQLVAAHRYSPRERVVRFLRRHRVPVGIGIAAAAALALGGAIAVVRVVAERDRADAAAGSARHERDIAEGLRADAEARAEELVLAQARGEVATNPTRAVALVAPLVDRRWREVRAIAAAARANGVAWTLPASAHTLLLELSADGRRALASGDDGVIRTHDLVTHATRMVATIPPGGRARWADDERRLVTWAGSTLTVLELASQAPRQLTVPSPVRDVAMVGLTAHWVDQAGSVWSLDLAGTQPLQRAIDEPVTGLAASPDGRWLALAGRYNLVLVDLTQPTAPPVTYSGAVDALDWSARGDRLGAIMAGRYSLDLEMSGAVPRLLVRDAVGERPHVVVGRDGLLAGGASGAGFVGSMDAAIQAHLSGGTLGVAEARGDTLLAAGRDGIAVIHPLGDRRLVPPRGSLERLAASPASPYVVGAAPGELLVWNLDAVQPRVLASEPPVLSELAGNRHIIAGFADGPTRWLELGGRTQALGTWGGVRSVAATLDETTVCVVDAAHRAHVVRQGQPAMAIEGTADVVGFVSPTQLVIAVTAPGQVAAYDLRTTQRRSLVERDASLQHLAWSRDGGAWVAASFDDRILWRRDLAAAASTTIRLDTGATAHLVSADGTVVFGDGARLRIWHGSDATGSALADLATFARPITTLARSRDGTIVVVLTDGTVQVVDLTAADPRRRVRPAPPVLVDAFALAADAGLFVEEQRGGIDVIDPVARFRWTLARPNDREQTSGARSSAYAFAAIAPDGNTVIAQTPTSLVAWQLDLPGDAAATQQWLGALTNATPPASTE